MNHKRLKRLLIIDDDQSVLFAFKKLFEKVGISVDTCESLEEAKMLIDRNWYKIIITDLIFSNIVNEAGIAVSRYAKSKNPEVIIILWTAADFSRVVEKARAAGIDFCFIKPVSPGIIQGLVTHLSYPGIIDGEGKRRESPKRNEPVGDAQYRYSHSCF